MDADCINKLLHIKDNIKCEKYRLRIDYLIKMINEIGPNKITDIYFINENRKIVITFKTHILSQEKKIYNKIVGPENRYYPIILYSEITFDIYNTKSYFFHKLYTCSQNNFFSVLYIYNSDYICKVYKPQRVQETALTGKFKDTILIKNTISKKYDIKIPNLLDYIYDRHNNIVKNITNMNINKNDAINFIINYKECSDKDRNKVIELINIFFDKNKFLSSDNLIELTQISVKNKFYLPYINEFCFNTLCKLF